MRKQNRSAARWSEIVDVRSRYQRSVHLERDAGDSAALDGYVVTPLVRTTVGRIGRGIVADRGTRSWSVTGPYGSGKSAFAVFLADLLGPADAEPTRAARKILGETDPTLYQELRTALGPLAGGQGLLPVLAVGSRAPIEEVLLSALERASTSFWDRPGRRPSVLHAVQKAAACATMGSTGPSREVVALFEQVSDAVAKSGRPAGGLLVVLDEAGKPLEHAAQTSGDVQVLQELAEASARSGEVPIVFVVLLHQSFEQYAGHLSALHRNEWAKVQGRFEDVPFHETAEETLRLVSAAIGRDGLPHAVEKDLRNLAAEVAEATAAGLGVDRRSLTRLLVAAAPLHPVTTLTLGPLFRSRLAQNERSLFAFLAAAEPYAFQDFLETATPPALYTLDRLYDYVLGAYAGKIYGQHARQWAQIESALRRLPTDAVALDAKVVKAIGLLGLLGESSGLRASAALLRAAMSDGVVVGDERALAESLDRLRSASIVVFRKYKDAFQLWEGSDIDLDASLQAAIKQVGDGVSLAQRLTRLVPPRPVVARRHLFETGTLRYFEVVYDDDSVINGNLDATACSADGLIRIILCESDRSASEIQRHLHTANMLAGKDEARKPQLLVVPACVERIRGLAIEIAGLERVQANTPELHDDPVGRREVAGRIAEAERVLRDEVSAILAGRAECRWFIDGEEIGIGTDRALSQKLSEICSQRYDKAPTVQNELVNRRHLSSSAAAVRRDLLEVMVTHGREERLGLQGTPPELSLFRSILEEHGLHRAEGGAWKFVRPSARERGSLRPAWDCLAAILSEAREKRVPVAEVYRRLRQPPFGLRDGILPILFVGHVLAREDEIALYEDGTFVPAFAGATVERLLRSPDKFAVQYVPIEGARASLYNRLAKLLGSEGNAGRSALVPIVRQLLRAVHSLPTYSRNTRRVSPRAQAVREAVLRAREPGTLLFRDLPVACGVERFDTRRGTPEGQVDAFQSSLKAALLELQKAYESLLGDTARALREAFGLPVGMEQARAELGQRAHRILALTAEPQLKSFLIRATDAGLSEEDWLVSLGTLLAGKPPESWSDQDVDVMKLNLGLMRRRFSTVEALMVEGESDGSPGTTMLRVAVAQAGQAERMQVIAVRDDDREMLSSFMSQIRSLAEAARASLPRDTILAGLGLLVQDLIGETELAQAEAAEEGKE